MPPPRGAVPLWLGLLVLSSCWALPPNPRLQQTLTPGLPPQPPTAPPMPGQQAPLVAPAAPDGTNAPGGAKLMWGGEAGMEGAAAAAKKYMGKPMDYYRLQTLQQFLSIYSADAEQVLGLARRQVTKLLGADATKKVFGGRHELFEEHRPLARFRSQFAKVLRASDDAGDHLTASFLEEQERQAKVAMTTTVGQGQGQGQGGRAGRVEERGGARRQRRREQQQQLLQKASKVRGTHVLFSCTCARKPCIPLCKQCGVSRITCTGKSLVHTSSIPSPVACLSGFWGPPRAWVPVVMPSVLDHRARPKCSVPGHLPYLFHFPVFASSNSSHGLPL